MTYRILALVLTIALVGCQTERVSHYGAPGCASCSGYTPPPAPPLRSLSTAPPPLATVPAPMPAPPTLSVPTDPLLGGYGGPPAKLGTPRVKVESKAPPLAVPPAPMREDEGPLPIELPGFTAVKPRVANGLQPFPEGIDWLKTKGYRTVLHLRPPGDDGAAAKRLFEKRGLQYLSLEVSAATLDEAGLREFSRIVDDEKGYPLFVYDKDGATAGGLWYLHNRVTLGESDEKSKAEAVRLGLRLDDGDDHKTMWLAVQALAAKLKP